MAEQTPTGPRHANGGRAGSAWKRAARAGVHRALDIDRLRAVVEADLAGRRRGGNGVSAAAVQAAPFAPGTTFTDRHGTPHVLDPGIRDRLKPRWRTMFEPDVANRLPSDKAVAARARAAERTVAEANALVAAATGAPLRGRILEVGCHDGAVAWQLSRIAGSEVVASDMVRYYVVQSSGEGDAAATSDPDAAIVEQQARLAELRALARTSAGPDVGTVEFVEDDITASTLGSGSLDAIVSFEVIEHVADPPAAFSAIARLLRPGGITYHDYNPFFAVNGGHSLGTLDMPWGHARLDDGDLERYLREIRPTEADRALGFVRESLNRLTLAGLDLALTAAGLEVVAVVPWVDRKLVPDLGPEVLADVRAIHPTATATDLLATFVSVIARRSDERTRVDAGPGAELGEAGTQIRLVKAHGRTVAIIQARMGSSRLPGKVLLPLLDRSILEHVVDRTGQAARVDDVVVATTTAPEDDAIVELASNRGWRSSRGSEMDLLDRYVHAAHEHEADVVVRITSDCPLIDPGLIDVTIAAFEGEQVDYASNTLEPRTFPRGLDVEVIDRAALEVAWRDDRDAAWREHATPYIYRHPERFRLHRVAADRDWSRHRWTVDTPDDYELVRRIYDALGNATFGWLEALAVVEANPDWSALNESVLQKHVPT